MTPKIFELTSRGASVARRIHRQLDLYVARLSTAFSLRVGELATSWCSFSLPGRWRQISLGFIRSSIAQLAWGGHQQVRRGDGDRLAGPGAGAAFPLVEQRCSAALQHRARHPREEGRCLGLLAEQPQAHVAHTAGAWGASRAALTGMALRCICMMSPRACSKGRRPTMAS